VSDPTAGRGEQGPGPGARTPDLGERPSPDALRLTVEGDEPLVIDIHPGDLADHGRVPEVRAVPPRPEDRAAGWARHEVTIDGWVFRVRSEPAACAELRARAGQAAERAGHGGAVSVRAQIPGRVVRVWVAPGDEVEAGGRLLAIEAMKMENEVRAPRAGTVAAVAVGPGDAVELGGELVRLE
jgi:biotin carboxyl carrier protein